MANELNIALKTGLTVTAQRYQAGAAVGSAISCPETGSTGFYSGNMTGAAGTYQLAFIAAGANVGSGSIVWSGTAEVPSSTFNPASDTVATVTTLTNAPTVPTAAAIASQVRTELSVELGRVDAAVSSRATAANIPSADITAIKAKTDALPASPAATGDIPSANITAIKAKTDLLNTDRLAQVSTVSTTGAQLAAALS
jgi:antitoxin (DNA-binding transcriptional repressor) of toxin-antitoxin stability system